MQSIAAHPFRIDKFPRGPLSTSLGCLAAERMLSLPSLNDLYARIRRRRRGSGRSFVEDALDELEIELTHSTADLQRIPKTGPLVIVANHPFGGIDGLALAALTHRVRSDVKVLANKMLAAVPELADAMLFVDAFGDAEHENLSSMRSALRWLKGGGALCFFPAGEVSHLRLRDRAVADGAWNTAAARLAIASGASVLPVFFEGRNSAMFQIAGLIHPRLRTALLPRELLKQRGRRINVHIGTPISFERLAKFDDPADATNYLRLRSSVLMGRSTSGRRERSIDQDAMEPVAAPTDADAIATEVIRLDSKALLTSSKHLHVYLARAADIPQTLREIGRLRETTFRLVGEGTGRSLDLDRFDQHYRHLFVWDAERRQVIGAYRLGLTDEILATQGADGLYTSTLFRFHPTLLDQLNPAVELGRSFVRVEYQKEFAPLMLLWKGIGHFAAANPRYRLLFGLVSISADYASLTKQILIRFLELNAKLPSLASLIAPRNPPAFGPPRGAEAAIGGRIVSSIDEVDELVAEIENDRRRVPVLLRQYLKLGAKLLGFNVDPDFGDVLDGLMLIDLMNVPRPILARYMGPERAAAFLASRAP